MKMSSSYAIVNYLVGKMIKQQAMQSTNVCLDSFITTAREGRRLTNKHPLNMSNVINYNLAEMFNTQ